MQEVGNRANSFEANSQTSDGQTANSQSTNCYATDGQSANCYTADGHSAAGEEESEGSTA